MGWKPILMLEVRRTIRVVRHRLRAPVILALDLRPRRPMPLRNPLARRAKYVLRSWCPRSHAGRVEFVVIQSPVPKGEGPGAPSAWFGFVNGTRATRLCTGRRCYESGAPIARGIWRHMGDTPTRSSHSPACQKFFSYTRVIGHVENVTWPSVLHNLSYAIYDDKYVVRISWLISLRRRPQMQGGTLYMPNDHSYLSPVLVS